MGNGVTQFFKWDDIRHGSRSRNLCCYSMCKRMAKWCNYLPHSEKIAFKSKWLIAIWPTVTLEPGGYINCTNLTMTFTNLSQVHLSIIISGTLEICQHLQTPPVSTIPSYTYPDTGIYTVKVVANRNQPCSDSTTAQVKVYPGFFPDFDITGICMNVPIQFTDRTTAAYGNVNFWRYDFGVHLF